MKNKDVLKKYLFSRYFRVATSYSKNLVATIKENGDKTLKNYNAIISKKENGIFFINSNYLHYTKTTQSIINQLIKLLNENNIKYKLLAF